MQSSPEKDLFSGLKPRCYHHNGRERYYITEHHCIRQYLQPVESGNDMLLQCMLFCRARSWTGDHHRRLHPPFLNIGLIHSGETAVRSGGIRATAKAGDAFFLAPDTEYELLTPHQCERSAVLISGPLIKETAHKSGLMEKPVFSLADPGILAGYFDQMAVKLQESYRHSVRREISSLCFELIQYLCAPENTRSFPDDLNGILEKIGREYRNPLRVTDLAAHAGISASSLTRLFRKHLGKTPYQYLIEIRMHQAARMLEQHTLSVKEIAERAGYENPLNFSTEFRKFFGKSPKHFLVRDS